MTACERNVAFQSNTEVTNEASTFYTNKETPKRNKNLSLLIKYLIIFKAARSTYKNMSIERNHPNPILYIYYIFHK